MQEKKELNELMEAINNYMNATDKRDYIFEPDEYALLLNKLIVLKKHLEMLANYETQAKR